MPPRFSPRFHRSPTSEDGSIRSSFHCSPVEEEKKMTDVEEKEGITMMPSCTSDTSLTSTTDRNVSSSSRDGKISGRNTPDGDSGNEKAEHKSINERIQEEQEREEPQCFNTKDNTIEARASPGLVIAMDQDGEGIEAVISHHQDMDMCDVDEMKTGHGGGGARSNDDECDDYNSHQSNPDVECVDDIAMSPLPYDREDPVTLMDLPDDLMTLPISPCGPHDEHGMTAS